MIYSGDGTYTSTIEIKYTAAAGGEARRRELWMIENIQKFPFVQSIAEHEDATLQVIKSGFQTLKEKA